LAWQQYFKSFARPVLAILKIEATDVNPDTPALGDYLAGRLRMLLATRPQIRVVDLASSHHPVLRDLSITDRASMLGADLLLSGTVNQSENNMGLGLQLYDAWGELVWSGQFDDRVLDQAQMQSAVLNALWDQLPLPLDALPETRRIVSSCEYPPDPEAIRMLFRSNRDGQIDQLTALIGTHHDNGLLHLARSLAFFAQVEPASPQRRPVISNLALQDLHEASRNCPDHPEIKRQHLLATRILQDTAGNYESYLAEFPSDAQIRRTLSDTALKAENPEAALMLAREAWLIDPLSDSTICHYDRIASATAKNKNAAGFRTAIEKTRPDLELPCPQ
jgi:TolB-like protein